MHWGDEQSFEADLRSALALDAAEHAFLDTLDLAGRWRQASQAAPMPGYLTWLPAAALVTAIVAWFFITPVTAQVAAGALGLAAAVLVRVALDVIWSTGQSLATLATSPLLSFSLPALALLGLALLVWPPFLKGQPR
jgi:hypothetical protein